MLGLHVVIIVVLIWTTAGLHNSYSVRVEALRASYYGVDLPTAVMSHGCRVSK
jgi:hypothetical protein